MINIYCGYCHTFIASYEFKKQLPKVVRCPKCYLVQKPMQKASVGHTPGRNETGHILPPGR